MRRLVLIIVAGLLSFPVLQAEESANITREEAYFGWRLGCDVSWPGRVSNGLVSMSVFTNGLGLEVGGIYNMPIAPKFYFEPGLKMYYDAYGVNKDAAAMAGADESIRNWSVVKYGFRVPVMMGYRFNATHNVMLSVFTGPEVELGLTAHERIKYRYRDYWSNRSEASNDLYRDPDGLKRVDVVWCIGVGMSCRNLYVGASGNFGMLNMAKTSGPGFHEHRVTVSVGCNF